MKRKPETTAADGGPVKRRLFTPTPLSPAQQKAVTIQVNKQLARKAEYKHCLASRAIATTVDYSGTVYNLLENLTRGDSSVNQFDGSSINARSIRIRGAMYPADSTNLMRIMVFQWRDSGIPVPSGLINNTGTIAAPFGSRFWTNKKNIKVLVDQLHHVDTYHPVQPIDIFIPGFKLRQTWFQSATDQAQNNGLFMLAVSDSSTVSHPAFTWVSEIVYTD